MTVSTPRPATLTALARAFGGDPYAGGRRALVPAPGHSSADRSVSLVLQDGRVFVHSFGAADWREVLDEFRARGWIDADNRLLAGGAPVAARGAPAPERTRAERIAAARTVWAGAGPVLPGSPAAAYIAARAVAAEFVSPRALGAHPAVPLGVYRDRGPRLAALLAAVIAPHGEVTAVEVTYVDARGRPSRLARPPRKIVGVVSPGSAVRLAEPAAEMLVAEGVFTTLSATARFGLPGWALLSTGNLRRWTAPPGVARVLIAGDRGPDGERSAWKLRQALRAAGVAADIVFPPAGDGDWNDLAQREGEEEGRPGAPGPQGLSRAAEWETPHVRNFLKA